MHRKLIAIVLALALSSVAFAEEADVATPALPDGWQATTLSTGVVMHHPADWRTTEMPGQLVILPAGFDVNSEMYRGSATPTPVRSITDPVLLQQTDMLMSQLQPGLRRAGEPVETPSALGDAIRLGYAGTLGDGRPGQAVVYGVLYQGHVVAMLGLGTNDLMAKRGETLRAVFASLHKPAAEAVAAGGEVDPKLVGRWLASTIHKQRIGRGGTYASTNTVYTLKPDGTWTSRSQGVIQAEGDHGGTIDATFDDANRGTWSAANGRLTVKNAAGQGYSGSYSVFSNGVEIVPDGSDSKILLEPVN
ncbi:MAG: hypothetical protein AAGI46_10570 [Planctomycetota bacterium]